MYFFCEASAAYPNGCPLYVAGLGRSRFEVNRALTTPLDHLPDPIPCQEWGQNYI